MSRRVLVTGGASGLGAALVDAFVARGDQALILDLAESYAGPEGTSYLRADVTSGQDWAAALAWVEQTWGGLDVLVNNAGIAAGGRIDECTLEEWQRAIDINLLGVVRGCQTFVPMMKQQACGHIVNTASVAGLVHPPAMGAYTAVKAGVVALSETLSYELHPWGITTSVVCPSFFRTNLAASMTGEDKAMGAIVGRLIDRSTITAADIAAVVMKGIDKKQAVIVTDAPARKAVRTKRFARPLYDREQRRFAAKINAIADRTKGTA
jgi:NAD(P)-dependent dehydrogenase (short-subunit alcohol dehydrogenase family)